MLINVLYHIMMIDDGCTEMNWKCLELGIFHISLEQICDIPGKLLQNYRNITSFTGKLTMPMATP